MCRRCSIISGTLVRSSESEEVTIEDLDWHFWKSSHRVGGEGIEDEREATACRTGWCSGGRGQMWQESKDDGQIIDC